MYGGGTVLPEFDVEKCDFCGGCSAVCPQNAITVFYDLVEVDKEICNECMVCKKVCPMNAILKMKSLKMDRERNREGSIKE